MYCTVVQAGVKGLIWSAGVLSLISTLELAYIDCPSKEGRTTSFLPLPFTYTNKDQLRGLFQLPEEKHRVSLVPLKVQTCVWQERTLGTVQWDMSSEHHAIGGEPLQGDGGVGYS